LLRFVVGGIRRGVRIAGRLVGGGDLGRRLFGRGEIAVPLG
jgi:hypothetical protein